MFDYPFGVEPRPRDRSPKPSPSAETELREVLAVVLALVLVGLLAVFAVVLTHPEWSAQYGLD